METRRHIESYLDAAGYDREEVAEGTWLLRQGPGSERIVMRIEHELVLFRVKVLELERIRDRAGLFQKLLELNATQMLHAAYGLADDAVVLTAALLLPTLDLEELRNAVEELGLALHNHRDLLAQYC